jgi:hypothetical protein
MVNGTLVTIFWLPSKSFVFNNRVISFPLLPSVYCTDLLAYLSIPVAVSFAGANKIGNAGGRGDAKP